MSLSIIILGDLLILIRTSHSIHSRVLDGLTTELNGALNAFITEIRDAQQVWDDVTVVVTSEFGRTLIGNTGKYIY